MYPPTVHSIFWSLICEFHDERYEGRCGSKFLCHFGFLACGVNGRIPRLSGLALVHLHVSRCLPLQSLLWIRVERWRENSPSVFPSIPGAELVCVCQLPRTRPWSSSQKGLVGEIARGGHIAWTLARRVRQSRAWVVTVRHKSLPPIPAFPLTYFGFTGFTGDYPRPGTPFPPKLQASKYWDGKYCWIVRVNNNRYKPVAHTKQPWVASRIFQVSSHMSLLWSVPTSILLWSNIKLFPLSLLPIRRWPLWW